MSVQLQRQPNDYTPEEYLALEEDAEYKSEYHDGEMIAMTGSTFNHNRIAVNVGTALKQIMMWLWAMSKCGYPIPSVFFILT